MVRASLAIKRRTRGRAWAALRTKQRWLFGLPRAAACDATIAPITGTWTGRVDRMAEAFLADHGIADVQAARPCRRRCGGRDSPASAPVSGRPSTGCAAH
jgi:hypothetical protein